MLCPTASCEDVSTCMGVLASGTSGQACRSCKEGFEDSSESEPFVSEREGGARRQSFSQLRYVDGKVRSIRSSFHRDHPSILFFWLLDQKDPKS